MAKRVPPRKNSLVVGAIAVIALAIAAVFVVRAVRIARRPTLLTILQSDPRFTIFRRIYESSDYPHFGKVPGQWTLFVPLDSGFDNLPKSELEQALTHRDLATLVIARHLVRGAFTSEKMRRTNMLENVHRFYLHIRVDGEKRIHVDDSRILEPDVMASNGVLHVLDLPIGREH
jgi:uncharacterized surface protein with fasciclin (FAS1) repeats